MTHARPPAMSYLLEKFFSAYRILIKEEKGRGPRKEKRVRVISNS